MNQQQLFYESLDDAIGSTIIALGGYKAVALRLWPTMKLESAYAKLKSCTNAQHDKREYLKDHEIEKLAEWGREIACTAIAERIASVSGGKFVPVKPEDAEAERQRQFIEAVKTLERLARQGLKTATQI